MSLSSNLFSPNPRSFNLSSLSVILSIFFSYFCALPRLRSGRSHWASDTLWHWNGRKVKYSVMSCVNISLSKDKTYCFSGFAPWDCAFWVGHVNILPFTWLVNSFLLEISISQLWLGLTGHQKLSIFGYGLLILQSPLQQFVHAFLTSYLCTWAGRQSWSCGTMILLSFAQNSKKATTQKKHFRRT